MYLQITYYEGHNVSIKSTIAEMTMLMDQVFYCTSTPSICYVHSVAGRSVVLDCKTQQHAKELYHLISSAAMACKQTYRIDVREYQI